MQPMLKASRADGRRRGVTAVFALISIVVLLGMASLTIDVGMLYRARAELQTAADSGALAGAAQLLDPDKLTGNTDLTDETAAARQRAAQYAGSNLVLNDSPTVDLNSSNSTSGDILVGYLSDPTNPNQALDLTNPDLYNSVRVRVHRDEIRNGPVNLFFAHILGHQTSNVVAEATATIKDGVTGYQVNDTTGNANLLPLALKITAWNDLLAATLTTGDNYTYDPDTGTVSAGSDGINELNLYPGAGAGQLPPGNFGTVDIGSSNNSTADIAQQILEGVTADDLSYFGGSLIIPPGGSVTMNGDTGLSAGIEDELTAIIGQPRAIPLFSSVSGNGNNANYQIVGFAGIRIMYVKLTGAMSQKKVIIQPAFVIDDAAITGPGSGSSYFIYQPVLLTR